MKRKLFCEISPFTYRLSMEKEILKRHVQDMLRKTLFARERTNESLPVVVYRHNSLIRRRLGNVNMQLQENKATNLALAVKHIDGLMIYPGETFSVWRLIGRTTKRKGYKEGLTIAKGKPSQGIGGGMCQLSNLIHWLVLHSELTITEHHHHDGLDLFPDFGRQIPFGTGTSISYNYIDYRFRNDTQNTYQLRLWTDEEYLCGELRATEQQPHTFHIHADNEFFSRENGVVYRNGEVYRDVIDRTSGKRLESQLIRTNHAQVMYEKEEIIRQLLSKVFDGIREKENSPGGYHHDSDRNIYYLKQILELDPLCESAWYQLYCEYLHDKHNHQKAVEVLENVYSLNPHGKRILSELACHYTYADRQCDKAEEFISQLLTYHADDPQVQRLVDTISTYNRSH